MALLTMVGRQTEGLDMDQACLDLPGFRKLENVLILKIPKS